MYGYIEDHDWRELDTSDKKIAITTISCMIVLYVGISVYISYYVYDIVNRNFGQSEHHYENENVYPNFISDYTLSILNAFYPSFDAYLTDVLDPSTGLAPVEEGKTYYNSFEMSFPFTLHSFTKATAKYYYSYEKYELEDDGTKNILQGHRDVCTTVYLEFKMGKWMIVYAEADFEL